VKQKRGQPLNQSGNSGINIGLRVGKTGNLGSIPDRTKGFFLCYKASSFLFNVYRGTGIERPGREADRSVPSSVEAKNEGSYTITSAYAFIGCTRTMETSLYRSTRALT
jgi:hypothetical protein